MSRKKMDRKKKYVVIVTAESNGSARDVETDLLVALGRREPDKTEFIGAKVWREQDFIKGRSRR